MYLHGAAALALLNRNRIPAVFGVTIDYEPDRPASDEPALPATTLLKLSLEIDRELVAPVLTVTVNELRMREDTIVIDSMHGLHNYQVIALANALELPRKSWQPLADAAQHLYRVFISADALSIALDPLAMESTGRLVTLDAHIYIDDSANFRHPEFAIGPPVEADDERLARMAGISYTRLGGQIGVIANGAGLAMATMDLTEAFGRPYGLGPANFMDIGGGARSDTVETGLRLLLNYHTLRAVVMNIFGGITRSEDVAQGITATSSAMGLAVPLVVRLAGVHAQTGRARLEQANLANLYFATTLVEAVSAAVQIARGS